MMTEAMEFPKTFDEFVNSYGLVDTEEVYTNGSQLIPVFRVKQWLEHISAKTQMIDKSNFDAEQYKTDLQSAYDCGYNKALSENKGDLISRQAVLDIWHTSYSDIRVENEEIQYKKIAFELPSVENKGEDRPKGHWIGHREHCENLGVMPSGLGAYEWCSNCDCGIDVREWHKNYYNFCPRCGADMRGEAE